LTLCWRELDSNLRFRARAGWILPVRFAADSLLEGDGFELVVPRGDRLRFRGFVASSINLSRAREPMVRRLVWGFSCQVVLFGL